MKTAIIVGSEGQDGRIISDLLRQMDYKVLGIGRKGAVDITNLKDVLDLCKEAHADEVYYLAACHQSSEGRSADEPALLRESLGVHVEGLRHFCEGIRIHNPKGKLFYAASSLIFEGTDTRVQDENTPFHAESIYGMTKLTGLLLCREYRAKYGVFASSGILYNHESIYRGDNFISIKIIKAALNIKEGKQDSLVLGDLNAQVDWGYAPDYVEAMRRILNIDQADDFIIASGTTHSVRDFAMIVFDLLGLDWEKYVREDKSLVARSRKVLKGDPKKLMGRTGWRPTVDFKGMIKQLLQAQEVIK